MSVSLDRSDRSPESLRAVLRPAPPLTPEDSLGRFLQLLRYQSITMLPVQRNGVLCGMVSYADLLPILAADSEEERERALRLPLTTILRPPIAVARPEMGQREVGRLCARHHLSLIPVADAEDHCLGVVLAVDLLAPELPPPCPPRIGGMATPFGVYLTDGNLQAGVGNGALIASGLALGLLYSLAFTLVNGGLWLAQRYAYLPLLLLYDMDFDESARHPLLGVASVGLTLLTLLIFLLLMRVTRLAGYHAAEHQTVHALERNEPLVPEVVRRMPRPHPRCGTNLMAAGLLLFTLSHLGICLRMDTEAACMLALLTTAITWRTVGTVLQERLTTKKASDREIASGIAAGKALVEKYLCSPPVRPRLFRRVWCMGLVQMAIGFSLAFAATQLFVSVFNLWR